MAETALLHALTRGRVQGVGFRFFVQDRAEEHGLTGYVRNLREGGSCGGGGRGAQGKPGSPSIGLVEGTRRLFRK